MVMCGNFSRRQLENEYKVLKNGTRRFHATSGTFCINTNEAERHHSYPLANEVQGYSDGALPRLPNHGRPRC